MKTVSWVLKDKYKRINILSKKKNLNVLLPAFTVQRDYFAAQSKLHVCPESFLHLICMADKDVLIGHYLYNNTTNI